MSTKSCCPPGSWPELAVTLDNDATAAGTLENLDGLDTYTVEPPQPTTNGVVFIYDVHGFSGVRVKSVCDALALNGFHVCMPDVYGDSKGVNDFGGFGSDTGKDFLKKYTFDDLEPKFDKAIAHLKSKGCTSIGAVGFCWGAWAVFKLSATGKLDAGAGCHPSIGIGPLLFGEQESDIASAVKCPQLLCSAGNDPDYVKENGDLVNIVNGLGYECRATEYPEMMHGWVIRGDATQENVARDVKAAIGEVSEFFGKHLKGSK
jgi:dienelactone hydrolase